MCRAKQCRATKTDEKLRLFGVAELGSCRVTTGVKELGSSDLHILDGSMLHSGHTGLSLLQDGAAQSTFIPYNGRHYFVTSFY